LNNNFKCALSDISATNSQWDNRNEGSEGLIDTLSGVGVGGGGRCCAFKACVVGDSSDIEALYSARASVLVVSSQKVAAWGYAGCVYDDVVTLTNVDVQDISGVRDDGNEVDCDHSKGVAIEVNLVCRLDGAVDDSEQVRGVLLQGREDEA